MAPIAFILISNSIINAGHVFSRTLIVAFVVLVVPAYALAMAGWNDTVRFTSTPRAIALEIQCLLPPLALIIILLRTRRHLTVGRAVMLHSLVRAGVAHLECLPLVGRASVKSDADRSLAAGENRRRFTAKRFTNVHASVVSPAAKEGARALRRAAPRRLLDRHRAGARHRLGSPSARSLPPAWATFPRCVN